MSWRSPILLLLSILMIAFGGAATLLWQMNHSTNSGAAGGNIVGPPTLSGDFVDKVFASVGSPMVGTGNVVEQTARETNIDDAFALAVWWTETNDGMAGVGRSDRDPGAVRGGANYGSGYDGYTLYPSYSSAIVDWFHVLRSRYVSQGLTSVYSICGPYVGTAGAGTWAAKVTTLMLHYRDIAPPMQILQHQRINDQPASVALQQAGEQPAPADPAREPLTSPESVQPPQIQPVVQSPALPLAPLFLALGGLLAASVLVFMIWRLRRGLPLLPAIPALAREQEAVVAATSAIARPVTPLPAVYANEFSPVLERASGPLEALPTGLLPPSTEALGQPAVQTTAALVPPVTPLPAFAASASAAPTGSGLFRRPRLVHSAATGSSVDTDSLPSLPGKLLPSRTLEPVGVASGTGSGRGGLLQRYRAENGD